MAEEVEAVTPDQEEPDQDKLLVHKRWVCPDCENETVAYNPTEDEFDYCCTYCGGYTDDRPPPPLKTYQAVEFTATTRYYLQVEADTEEEARAAALEVARDGSCSGMAILDEDRPVLLFDDIEASRETFMFAGSPFGSKPEWLRSVAARLIEEAATLEAAEKTIQTTIQN